LLRVILKRLAIDRPINTRKYIVEQLQRQAALEARAKYEKKVKADQDGGQTDEDPTEEKDTLQDEEEYDMNTLLFPDGYLPTNKVNFSFHYNMQVLKGWVRQTSPACAAASVAGAWNALLMGGDGRKEEGALFQPDIVDTYIQITEEQIAARRTRLERLLQGSVRPIEAAVVLHLKGVGKVFGGKGENGVRKSEAMQVLRHVVNTSDGEERPYKLLAEAFAASDISAEADEDDIAGDDDDWSDGVDLKTEMWALFGRLAAMERISRPNRPSTADIGNGAVRQAIARISAQRENRVKGAALSTSVAVARKAKRNPAEITISKQDDATVQAEQWLKLRDIFCRPDCVLIYHLKNHYALVYAMREWTDRNNGEPVRELLTSRRGQRPSAWVSWAECRETVLRWHGHCLIRVQRRTTPQPLQRVASSDPFTRGGNSSDC